MSLRLDLLVIVLTCQTVTSGTSPFSSPRYGLKLDIPERWPIVVKERDDRIFVAVIDRGEPDRPGAVACEIGLAPETLEEYRTRIDGNAKRDRRAGSLTRNSIVDTPKGPRLETTREFHPKPDSVWIERSTRIVENRQMYTFIINVDSDTYARVRPEFEQMIESARFSPPRTGTVRVDAKRNRWLQSEFKFELDLPSEWSPVLAPAEVALLYANGPAHGIWSDNCLVIAKARGDTSLEEQQRQLPKMLKVEDPGCELLQCEIVRQGKVRALESIVRTQRGPFSMTVLERRFRGDRFDYEVKYTLESKRFDELLPVMRRSLDSFAELPGNVPGLGKSASRALDRPRRAVVL